jgi:hypothetical protein
MVIGGAAMIGSAKLSLSFIPHDPGYSRLPGVLNASSGPVVSRTCELIAVAVIPLYTMSQHNGDSQTERGGDERSESVSIGELLRSTHSISHLDRYTTYLV